MTGTDQETPRPLVAMVVGDAAMIKGRVGREALALIRTGFEVTLFTVGEAKHRSETRLGAVHVVRVAVPYTLTDARRQSRARRRARVPRVGYRDPLAERAARTRLQASRLSAASTGVPVLTGALLMLREQTIAVRCGAQRALTKAFRLGWRGVDATVDALPTGSSWRRRLPKVDDFEAVFGREIDRLEPDALYVHGVTFLAVAARASARARLAGRQVPWVYEVDADTADAADTAGTADTADPVDAADTSVNESRAPEGARSARDRAASVALEKEFVAHAAIVVAVNDPLADALQIRYRLPARPLVIPDQDLGQLGDAYLGLLDAKGLEPRPDEPADDVQERPVLPDRVPYEGPLVGFGPANMAGQGWAWAKALERAAPGTRTEVLMVDRGGSLIFPADELVPATIYRADHAWQQSTRERVLSTWTHALIEAGRPLMGGINGLTFAGDAVLMELAGVTVGLVFHGSELRDPRHHAALHRWSPFHDTSDDWVRRVQATVDLLRPEIDAFAGPCLVSTPDLLDDLPRATWLPVVVDCEIWSPRPERPEPAVPVVVHTPSRAAIKGSAFVEEALAPLVAEGLVDYRRVEGISPEQMPQVMSEADIVLDQFAIASYGALACQAMAIGTAVVGHVSAEVRNEVEKATGHVLPIVEANPDTLQETLRRLVAQPEVRRAAAEAGPVFVRAVHDGRRSGRILAEALGIEPSAPNV